MPSRVYCTSRKIITDQVKCSSPCMYNSCHEGEHPGPGPRGPIPALAFPAPTPIPHGSFRGGTLTRDPVLPLSPRPGPPPLRNHMFAQRASTDRRLQDSHGWTSSIGSLDRQSRKFDETKEADGVSLRILALHHSYKDQESLRAKLASVQNLCRLCQASQYVPVINKRARGIENCIFAVKSVYCEEKLKLADFILLM